MPTVYGGGLLPAMYSPAFRSEATILAGQRDRERQYGQDGSHAPPPYQQLPSLHNHLNTSLGNIAARDNQQMAIANQRHLRHSVSGSGMGLGADAWRPHRQLSHLDTLEGLTDAQYLAARDVGYSGAYGAYHNGGGGGGGGGYMGVGGGHGVDTRIGHPDAPQGLDGVRSWGMYGPSPGLGPQAGYLGNGGPGFLPRLMPSMLRRAQMVEALQMTHQQDLQASVMGRLDLMSTKANAFLGGTTLGGGTAFGVHQGGFGGGFTFYGADGQQYVPQMYSVVPMMDPVYPPMPPPRRRRASSSSGSRPAFKLY